MTNRQDQGETSGPIAPMTWGVQPLAEDDVGSWRIGDLELWIQRCARELRVAYRSGVDPKAAHLVWENLGPRQEAVPEGLTLHRLAAEGLGELALNPALADRPVVVRAENPLSVIAGAAAEIYVSTPLWVTVGDGRPGAPMVELGAVFLRPTWFGTPASGELCYAVRTRATLDLASLDVHPLRCVTRLVLSNQGRTPLVVERIKIPMLHLSLFATSSGHFRTQNVTVTRREEEGGIDVRVDDSAPPGATEELEPPRQPTRGFLRALNAWLG